MKKIILCFIFLFTLTACKDESIMCKAKLNNQVENYLQESEYKIYYKNSFVTKVEKKDIYSSKSKEKINYLEEINRLILGNYGNGYTFDIKKEDNKLTINSEIDMSMLEIQRLIDSNILNEEYVVSNKITLSGLIKYYESKGLTCDI